MKEPDGEGEMVGKKQRIKEICLDHFLEKESLEGNLISDPNFPSPLLCVAILRGFEIQKRGAKVVGEGLGKGFGYGFGKGDGTGNGNGYGNGIYRYGYGFGYGNGLGKGNLTYIENFGYIGSGHGYGKGLSNSLNEY